MYTLTTCQAVAGELVVVAVVAVLGGLHAASQSQPTTPIMRSPGTNISRQTIISPRADWVKTDKRESGMEIHTSRSTRREAISPQRRHK
ncbi:hypothetical protein DFP73DRAFT_69890 [Morchella snyderi]|nr:hypothetical protein DFP73DRAFT_69890 [Morchella snyderi]